MDAVWGIVYAFAAALLALVVYVVVDLATLPKSRFHTTKTLLTMYLMKKLLWIPAALAWRSLKKDVQQFVKAQERFVLRQIRDNENTQYGRDHQFGRIHSLADFRRLHPVTSYSHYETYVERAEQGDTTAILGKDNLEMFACSSGTTGKAKHIPVSSQVRKSMMGLIGALYGFHPDSVARNGTLFKEMQVLCLPRWRYSASGLPIGPMSGLFMKSEAFMVQWSTPFKAVVIDTEAEAMYVSLLFGLRDRDLYRIEGSFASGLLNILHCLENNWQDLAADIKSGRLKESLDLSWKQRHIINSFLIPDPERAMEVETECKKGMDGILRRIFPKLQMVSCLSSGTSMSLYKQRCRRYVGDIPMMSMVYGSSEAFMGVNMRSSEHEPAYVLLPSMAFVEFLPVDETGSAVEGQEPLLADQVQIGQLYELVVTNCSGFYRYRMGDIVKVVDFYHQAPAIDFQFRAGQLLNVHMEKLSEESFFSALQTAASRWPGVTLKDFTCAESVLDPSPRAGAPYYLVFLELEGADISDEQKGLIDSVLCEQNYVYKSFRVKNSIAPMKVMTLEPGTFTAFRQFQFDTTTAFVLQYKQPRVLRNNKQVEFFMQHVLEQPER